MRKRGLSLIFGLLCTPAVAHAEKGCELNPNDADVAAKLADAGRVLELRRAGAGGCRIALDCTVRAAPVRVRYELGTLVQGKVAPYASQMTYITFEFADGTVQACRNAGATDMD